MSTATPAPPARAPAPPRDRPSLPAGRRLVGPVLRQRARRLGEHGRHAEDRGRGLPPDAARPRRGGAPDPAAHRQILYDELAADLRATTRRRAGATRRTSRAASAPSTPSSRLARGRSRRGRHHALRRGPPSDHEPPGRPLANGTINRELSLLGTMLRLAARRRKVLHPPTIPRLKEAAPRAGFFEADQFAAVRRRLRPDLQLAVDLAYTYGWRVRDEVLTLARRHVDLGRGHDPAGPRARPRTTTAAWCTSRPPSRLPWPSTWTRVARWSGRSAGSSPGCSRTRPTARSTRRRGSGATGGRSHPTFAGPGGRPASGPAAPGCSGTTSGGRRCGTW